MCMRWRWRRATSAIPFTGSSAVVAVVPVWHEPQFRFAGWCVVALKAGGLPWQELQAL